MTNAMQSSMRSRQTKDYGWQEPICLIENLEGDSMKLNPAAAEKLSQIEDKLVVVAIVGLYRTGKSYLMNRLAGKNSGFELGSTIQAKTKGIWIWCVPHPKKSDTCLTLLDTEGLGDVEKGDSKNDTMLFTLAALLSSTLVYNSQGTIDQTAMDRLHFVTEIAEQVKVSKSEKPPGDDDEEDTKLIEYLPSFVWAVRDFVLDLQIDGKAVTADGYLERSLELKKGAGKKITEYNLPRRCIRRYFPQRRCFVFPHPVMDSSLITKVGNLTEQQLSPAFVTTASTFCNHVFDTSPIKTVSGLEFSGRNFVCLARSYVEDLSTGRIPCIQSIILSTAERVNEDVLKACVQLYADRMAAEVSGRLPVESIDELRAMHQRCELSAKELLSRRAMVVDVDGNLVPRLTEMIGKEFEKVSADNDRLSAEKSFSVLNKLHAKISERLDSSYYFKTGGYTDYQQDIGSMVREYMAAPGKGVKAFDVLDEFMVKQQIISKNVMHNDKHLTEQQKRAEEMEKQQEYLRREQEKMRRQVELAEQRVKDEARQRQEFSRSLEAKFEKERQEYQRQLSQLQPLLAREQERLKKEKAQEDAEEMAEALRQLRLRCQPPQSPQRRIVFF